MELGHTLRRPFKQSLDWNPSEGSTQEYGEKNRKKCSNFFKQVEQKSTLLFDLHFIFNFKFTYTKNQSDMIVCFLLFFPILLIANLTLKPSSKNWLLIYDLKKANISFLRPGKYTNFCTYVHFKVLWDYDVKNNRKNHSDVSLTSLPSIIYFCYTYNFFQHYFICLMIYESLSRCL